MFLFLSRKLSNVLHVIIVNLDSFITLVQTENHFKILRVTYPPDTVIMQQIILLFTLLDLNLKLSVLLLLLNAHQLTQNIPKK